MKAMEYKGQKVITTAMLAEAYGTSVSYISNNFNRNKSKFIEEKHYFLLKGKELKAFLGNHLKDECLNKYAGTLYLWTERGANHHCKILDTDKAWEQLKNLVKYTCIIYGVPLFDLDGAAYKAGSKSVAVLHGKM